MLFPMQQATGMGGVSTPGRFAATGPAESEQMLDNIFELGLTPLGFPNVPRIGPVLGRVKRQAAPLDIALGLVIPLRRPDV